MSEVILDTGGTSTISETKPGYVTKRLKRKGTQKGANLQRERRIHEEVYAILEKEAGDLKVRAPKLNTNTGSYTMEKVDTSNPLYNLSTSNTAAKEAIVNRVKEAIKLLGRHGILLKDSEAFYQPDSSIVLLDFGQAQKIEPTEDLSVLLQSGALLPSHGGRRRSRRTRRKRSMRKTRGRRS